MLLLIDNYDSFTYNLVHFFGDIGADCEVVRNDKNTVQEALARRPDAIVISPGPGTPADAGICVDLIRENNGRIPLFGVCLGHQAIGEAYGAKITRAGLPMHGKLSSVSNAGDSVFAGLPSKVEVTRYHSLVIDRASLPDCLIVTAETKDGSIMGVRHRDHPVHGVQFHPESIKTELGHDMLANFLKLAGLPVQRRNAA